MDNFLIDQEDLGEFIDELLKHKALPVNSAEELAREREALIKALYDKITIAIFSQFTDEQGEELKQLLARDEDDKETYQAFFDKIGLDLDATISNAMTDFAKEFLGGKDE